MSKGTIRLPASAITDGRIGTARIREQVASAAAQLAATSDCPLDRAMSALTSRDFAGDYTISVQAVAGPSPLERMQQLGRGTRGQQNKTETAYENEVLKPQLHAGEILWYRFEAIKLRLADRTFLTPDFPVITRAGELEFREVKGHWTDDARAKTKVAAAQFPFRFYAVQRAGRHGWRVENLTSESW